MIRITSLNLNGIRSAFTKGLETWLATYRPDIVCMQETKAHLQDIKEELQHPLDYTGHFCSAEKKGYSGVGIYLKAPAERVATGMECEEFDAEGRIIRADFAKLSVISAYLPSGSSSPERQEAKFRFLAHFEPWLQERMKEHLQTGREFVICGDWNMCHQPIDLKNWRANQKNSGFLPQERAWLGSLYDEVGYVDAFRHLYPERHAYSWWSNRGQARANNVGWRLDYHLVTPGLVAELESAVIYTDQNFSDHAPVTLKLSRQF